MMSGSEVITLNQILAPSGATIFPGTACMVLGQANATKPVLYLVETNESPYAEQEEFYCYAVDLERV